MALTDFWLEHAKRRASKDVRDFNQMKIVDGWKCDGPNDGTTSLYLICEEPAGTFVKISMPDYEPTEVKSCIRREVVSYMWEEQ